MPHGLQLHNPGRVQPNSYRNSCGPVDRYRTMLPDRPQHHRSREPELLFRPGYSSRPTSLSWGNTVVGQSTTSKTVTLTNSSGAALTIASIAVGSDYTIVSKTCPISPSTLAIGSSCTISVAFRPLAQGLRSDVITVTDDNASSPQQVPLSGTGVIGVGLFAPTSLTFPTTAVGKSPVQRKLQR